MALITNNISGSERGAGRIGITGSVVIGNAPQSLFPTLGSDAVFFVSGSETAKSVFGGAAKISGSLSTEGNVTLGNSTDDTVTISGTSTFAKAATFSSGLSGSLTNLTDGTSYLIAGSNVTISSASNGAITISSTSTTNATSDTGWTLSGGSSTQTFSYISGTVQSFVVPTGVTSVNAYVWAGGGGTGGYASFRGGAGGFASGSISVTPGDTLYIVVGGGGSDAASASGNGGLGGWPNAGFGTRGDASGGGGGGYSGIFSGSNTPQQVNSLLIAGGGGGGTGYKAGGGGGGSTGNTGGSGGNPGQGGTQIAGGTAGNGDTSPPRAGSALTGGNAGGTGQDDNTTTGVNDGGGGGSGYYGGGGGASDGSGGGGGSGYYHPSKVTGGSLQTGADGQNGTLTAPAATDSQYYSSGIGVGSSFTTGGGNGYVVLAYSTGEQLTYTTSSVSIGTSNLPVESNFYVSGTMGLAGSSAKKAIFGGDVVISGTLYGGSPLKIGNDVQITGSLNISNSSALSSRALSGSLTRLTDGTSYLIAGSGISITTGSSGAVTITNDGTVGDITAVTAGTGLTGGGVSGGVTLNINDSVVATISGSRFTGEVSTASGVDIAAGNKLRSDNSSGDEGGEILLAKPVTNTTLDGIGITIDAYQNKIRFFEQGGSARGAYIDLTACSAGVGTDLLAGGGGGDITAVTAGTGLTGGGTSGAVTLNIDNSVVATISGSRFTGDVGIAGDVGIGTPPIATARLLVSGTSTGTDTTLMVRHGVAQGSLLPVFAVMDSAGSSLLLVSGSGATTINGNTAITGTFGVNSSVTSTNTGVLFQSAGLIRNDPFFVFDNSNRYLGVGNVGVPARNLHAFSGIRLGSTNYFDLVLVSPFARSSVAGTITTLEFNHPVNFPSTNKLGFSSFMNQTADVAFSRAAAGIINFSGSAPGAIFRFNASSTPLSAGDLGMNAGTGRPNALIGGSVRELAHTEEIAPLTSNYIVTSADATLPNERVLTAGTGIILTDGGAGSTVTLGINNGIVATVSGTTFTGAISAPGITSTTGLTQSGGNISITGQTNGVTVIGNSDGTSTVSIRAGAILGLSGSASTNYIVGGETGTGTITIGQSTASNTINIGNAGSNTSNTQTVNIAAGSGASTITIGSAAAHTGKTTIQGGTSSGGGVVIGQSLGRIGFFGLTTPVTVQTVTDITNSVASGGTSNTLSNYTSLSNYSSDASAIRGNFYQIGVKLNAIIDALQAYGLF